MTEFVIGDRVRFVHQRIKAAYVPIGSLGRIANVGISRPFSISIEWDNGERFAVAEDEIELLEETKPKYRHWHEVQAERRRRDATDPIEETQQNELPLAEWELELLERAESEDHDSRLWVDGEGDGEFVTVEDWAASQAPLRAQVLDEAKSLIVGDRNNQYGEPDQDFQRTANALNAFGFRKESSSGEHAWLAPDDVATIQILVKLSRLQWNPSKRDSWVDVAGYAACGAECAGAE